jgi:hypothetical protein
MQFGYEEEALVAMCTEALKELQNEPPEEEILRKAVQNYKPSMDSQKENTNP